MKLRCYGGGLDGQLISNPFMVQHGPVYPGVGRLSTANYVHTRGGQDQYYAMVSYNGYVHLLHHHTGPLPSDWDSRDKTPEVHGEEGP